MVQAGDSNAITRAYFDSILVKTRLIDSELPDLNTELFGEQFRTPVATAALSHLNGIHDRGMAELARGAQMAGAVNFCGMESYEDELADIMEAQAKTIRIIKPHANNAEVFKRIERAKQLGVFALGMDIDHAYHNAGGYDVVENLPMRPKSKAELREFVLAAGELPFVIKGVLSAEDAEKCVEIGAAGIVVSHHHGIMSHSVPPLMVLPEIVKAVDGKVKIFVDCGIESGMDVYKALALGADFVCVGRELMGYLKDQGAVGVADRIDRLTGELSVIMARTGFHSLQELDDACLVVTAGEYGFTKNI